MPRLAADRATQLTAAEIAAETLRQFDTSATEPSIRTLAAALHVSPTAIYHHFPSRAAIYQAAVELTWWQAFEAVVALAPDPEGDPVEMLVAAGTGTRRTWLAHYRLARYMAATPQANEFTATSLQVLATAFTRMGLDDARAAIALHSYASFMVGAVLFAADRKAANEELLGQGAATPAALDPTRFPAKDVMQLSDLDPARDEVLYIDGLRKLIRSLAT